jgi:hypothetical protein
VVLPDYLLTCVVAVLERQPRLLLLGVFFPFMRMLDAYIGLYAIPAAWLSRSSGRWKSPARRAVEPGDAATVSVTVPAAVPATVPAAAHDKPAVRAMTAPGLGTARTGAGPGPHCTARVTEASHVSG